MATTRVQLVSPEREVFAGEAQAVYARTTDGELGILPGHAPLIGTLVSAPVRIELPGGGVLVAAVHGGFISVFESGVSVLGEEVELREDIDVAAARADVERYRTAEPGDTEGLANYQRALARLNATEEPA
ncbi:MAG: F0F1 ATP synthase subunit epsilon [Mycobacteriales bacterium]